MFTKSGYSFFLKQPNKQPNVIKIKTTVVMRITQLNIGDLKNNIAQLSFGLFLMILLFPWSFVHGQITMPAPMLTPKQAVEDVLLGPGIQASNFTFNGSPFLASNVQQSVKRFVNSSAAFPMEEGVFMTTSGGNSVSSDPDLNAINLSSSNITNGAIIEFDFIPDGDTLSFSYIFASAEYQSFTCSNYNDVFGFFISGPGITGPYSNNSMNIATIPNSGGIPVGINTVNAGTHSDLNDNCKDANPNWQNDSQYWTNSYNGIYSSSNLPAGFTNFNGSTVVLTANASLICGETYHIKLAISNVSDQAFDSGVFLLAGSFESEPSYEISSSNLTTVELDTVIVEGCDQGAVCFERPIELAQDTAVVYFDILGTATYGQDYTIVGHQVQPDSLIFYPGDIEYCFEINPIDDGILEGLESIIFSTYSVNACGDTIYNSSQLWIADKPDVPIPDVGTDFAVCDGGTGQLNATPASVENSLVWSYTGPGNIVFSPNNTVSDPQISFDEPGVYTLTLTEANDTCGVTGSSDLTVVYGFVDMTLSNDTTICQNGTATLIANAFGNTGDVITYTWGHVTDNLSTVVVNPTETTTYTVIAENQDGCTSDLLEVTVNVLPPLSVTVTPDWQSICPGEEATINSTATGGNGGPYTFEWRDDNGNVVGNNSQLIISPNITTEYTLTVSDGCETTPVSATTIVEFDELPPVLFSVTDPAICTPAVFELINDTDPDLYSEAYWYISNGMTFANQDTIYPEIKTPGVYDVQMVIVTPNGCIDSASINYMLQVYPEPEARFTYTPHPTTILNTEVRFQNGTTGADSYVWTFEDGHPSYSTFTNPTSTFPEGVVGNYDVTLIAISEYGCTDTLTKNIRVLPEVLLFAPNTFTPDGDGFNEVWKLHLSGIDIYDVKLEVFNRWGEQVFESYDLEYGWDGTYNGHVLPEGTYVWKLQAGDAITDERHEWNGFVTILK